MKSATSLMAICSPYGSPAAIERSEKNDRGGVLADLYRIKFADLTDARGMTRDG